MAKKYFRIGIDFDNTIVNYDSVFTFLLKKKFNIYKSGLSKKSIRKLIINLKNEKSWMQMQGQAYGKYMHKSIISPGFINFLYRSILNGSQIFIVSHKTKFGHFDKSKTNLRNESKKWLKKNVNFNKKICIPEKNIFFLSSIHHKIKKIKSLNLDFFIDDLELILENKNFPSRTKKILFNDSKINNKIVNFPDWRNISHYIFGREKLEELKNWVTFFTEFNIKSIIKIEAQKNSQVFKIQTNEKKNFCLKYYPNPTIDELSRLENEYNSMKLFQYLSLNTPKAIYKNTFMNFGIFEFLNGSKIIKKNTKNIETILEFIIEIQKIKKIKNNKVQNAKEACLTINELIKQIEFRFIKLKETNLVLKNIKLSKFLNKFEHVKNLVIKKIYQQFDKIALKKILEKKYQIIHPADFGFHNSIVLNDRLYFLDFEYLGYDDPVKLISDFYWHPGMNLNTNMKKTWLFKSKKIFNYPGLNIKLKYLLNAYGLRWSLIILNDFIKINQPINKINYNNNKFYDNQIKKSLKLLKMIINE